MATSTTSASQGLGLAAGGGLDGDDARPAPVFSTLATLWPRWNLKPCFSRMRWNSWRPRRPCPAGCGRGYSTTVTSAPRRCHTEPSLQPDHAGADDEQLFRHDGQGEGAGRGHDDLLVDLDAGQPRDVGAGGDDDVLGVVRDLAPSALFTDDLARRRAMRRLALEPVDLVLLEQEGDAVDVGGDRLVLVLHHAGEIELRLDHHAEMLEAVRRPRRRPRRRAAAPSRGCSRC